MSKNISTNLKSHIAQEVTTLATCWKITRKDGVTFGFTEHSDNILFEGVTYTPQSGFTPSSTVNDAGLKVDNLEVVGVFNLGDITRGDLEEGLYDSARCEIFLVNYEDLTMGSIILKKGLIGNVKSKDNDYIAEIRGLTEEYKNIITSDYSPLCRVELGTTPCGIDIAALTVNGTVLSIVDNYEFTSDVSNVNDYFVGGVITWLTGLNAGKKMEVKKYLNVSGTIGMFLKMPNQVSIGDTFNITPGCDKSLGTCIGKFNNAVNFRGEPHVPGSDIMVRKGRTVF